MKSEDVVIVRGTIADLSLRFADAARDAAFDGLKRRGRCSLVITGGSVARAFLPALFTQPIDWDKVDVYFGDERAVPPHDPESNYALARSLWLGSGATGSAPRFHRMQGEREDQVRAAEDYAALLQHKLGAPPTPDLVLLGVGEDGHVCSLFPGASTLEVSDRWAVAVSDSPKPPPRRLTMTFAALGGARQLHIAAFGAAKADVMAAALEDPTSALPVARALRLGPPTTVYVDDGAAAALSHVNPR